MWANLYEQMSLADDVWANVMEPSSLHFCKCIPESTDISFQLKTSSLFGIPLEPFVVPSEAEPGGRVQDVGVLVLQDKMGHLNEIRVHQLAICFAIC
jgi:hypothetical protein